MGFLDFLTKSKIGRILVFIFIFIFVFRTIDYVLQFFDVNIEMGYTFFIWITILFLLFALLPVQWSGFFLTKKENGSIDATGAGGSFDAGGSIDAGGGGGSGGFGASLSSTAEGYNSNSNNNARDTGSLSSYSAAADGGGGSGDGQRGFRIGKVLERQLMKAHHFHG